MQAPFSFAPELEVIRWFNTDRPLKLAECWGRVVALHAFQMLCPGCVSHGLPQASAIRATFPEETVTVIGLHTVFEHHAVMGPDALEAFIHEYRLSFPIAVDRPAPTGTIPLTMQAYDMRGTPSLILIDKAGRIRLNHFGRLDDMRVGALIGQLIGEPSVSITTEKTRPHTVKNGNCDEEGCQRG